MSKADHVSKKRAAPDRSAQLPTGEFQSNFPTFQQLYLQSFRFCACFPLDDTALSRLAVPGKKMSRETRFTSHCGPAWIRAYVARKKERDGSEKPKALLQVDCALESVFRPSRTNLKPQNTPEEVQEYLKLFSQQKTAIATCCEGVFSVPRDKLPQHGVVRLMFDISVTVGKATMNMTGASFDIQGCPPFEEVRWRQKVMPGKDGGEQNVEITLLASPDVRIAGNPQKVAAILSEGMQEVVMEMGE